MQTTTNYGFNIVEGTDIVNPLTQLNPNFTALDSDLKAVSDNTVDNATCIKTGTVHAVTRVNTDASVFKFTATGNWATGDTMTVDGTLVSVYMTDGSAPADSCFVINTEVLASIQGTRVTLYAFKNFDISSVSASDIATSTPGTNVQDALDTIPNIQAGVITLPYFSQYYLMDTVAITGTPKAVCLTRFTGDKAGTLYYEVLSPTSLRIRMSGNYVAGDSQDVAYIIIY